MIFFTELEVELITNPSLETWVEHFPTLMDLVKDYQVELEIFLLKKEEVTDIKNKILSIKINLNTDLSLPMINKQNPFTTYNLSLDSIMSGEINETQIMFVTNTKFSGGLEKTNHSVWILS